MKLSHPRRPGLARVLLIHVACLASCLLSAEALPARAVFVCPTGHGLCSWNAGTGWSTIWDEESGRSISDFWQARDGRLVVLLRGHQNPGRIVVLDANGAVLATRFLPESFEFHAIATQGTGSDIWICGGSTETPSCDLVLPGSDRSSTSVRTEFPPGCLFPRFRPSGAAICIPSSITRHLTPTVMLQDGAGSPFFKAHDLGLSRFGLEDLVVLDENAFLILADNTLYLYDGGSLSKIGKRETALWVSIVAGRVFVTRVLGMDQSAPSYEFCELVGRSELKVAWSSRQLEPQRIEYLGDGTFLLHAFGSGLGELISLQGPPGRLQTRVVWTAK